MKKTQTALFSSDFPMSFSLTTDKPFSASVKQNSTGIAIDFKFGDYQEPYTAGNDFMVALNRLKAAIGMNAMSTGRLMLADSPYSQQSSAMVKPASARALICDSAHTKTMKTLYCRVKWYDSTKGYGFLAPIEPGHPDIFLSDSALRAAGITDPQPGAFLMATFDPSHYTGERKPKALVVELP
jgi:cold shock CspA family protein